MKTEKSPEHAKIVNIVLKGLKGLTVKQANKVLFEALRKIEEAVY